MPREGQGLSQIEQQVNGGNQFLFSVTVNNQEGTYIWKAEQ
jgi:hypothetical protein